MNNKVFKKGYIYHICNMIDDMIYIGRTIDIESRWNAHKNCARNGRQPGKIYELMRKYGIGNFYFQIICEVEYINDIDLDIVESMEIYKIGRINKLNRGHGYISSGFRDEVKLTYFDKY